MPCHFCCRCRRHLCRRQVEGVKDAMNTAAAGGSAARRIAGEVGREYILHKDAPQGEEADGGPAAVEEAAAVPAEPQGQQQQQGAQQGAAGAAAGASASASAGAGAGAAAAGAGGTPAAAEVLDICFDVELGASDASEWQDQRFWLSNALPGFDLAQAGDVIPAWVWFPAP
jgi:hypothetical protein